MKLIYAKTAESPILLALFPFLIILKELPCSPAVLMLLLQWKPLTRTIQDSSENALGRDWDRRRDYSIRMKHVKRDIS